MKFSIKKTAIILLIIFIAKFSYLEALESALQFLPPSIPIQVDLQFTREPASTLHKEYWPYKQGSYVQFEPTCFLVERNSPQEEEPGDETHSDFFNAIMLQNRSKAQKLLSDFLGTEGEQYTKNDLTSKRWTYIVKQMSFTFDPAHFLRDDDNQNTTQKDLRHEFEQQIQMYRKQKVYIDEQYYRRQIQKALLAFIEVGEKNYGDDSITKEGWRYLSCEDHYWEGLRQWEAWEELSDTDLIIKINKLCKKHHPTDYFDRLAEDTNFNLERSRLEAEEEEIRILTDTSLITKGNPICRSCRSHNLYDGCWVTATLKFCDNHCTTFNELVRLIVSQFRPYFITDFNPSLINGQPWYNTSDINWYYFAMQARGYVDGFLKNQSNLHNVNLNLLKGVTSVGNDFFYHCYQIYLYLGPLYQVEHVGKRFFQGGSLILLADGSFDHKPFPEARTFNTQWLPFDLWPFQKQAEYNARCMKAPDAPNGCLLIESSQGFSYFTSRDDSFSNPDGIGLQAMARILAQKKIKS